MKKVILVAILAAIIIAGVSSAYMFSDDKIEDDILPEQTSEPTSEQTSEPTSEQTSEPTSGTNYSIELTENLAVEQTP